MSKGTRLAAAAIVNTAAFLCVFFSGCENWNEPLYYVKEGHNATVSIYVAPYPCPNTFIQGEAEPANDKSEQGWEALCNFSVWGIKGDDTLRRINPGDYSIEGFDSTTENKTIAIKVSYKDSANGELSTTFSVRILPKGIDYYEIHEYKDPDGGGSVIPFPSKAEAGTDIKVIVSANNDYKIVEARRPY
jgi:hypothetical protein